MIEIRPLTPSERNALRAATQPAQQAPTLPTIDQHMADHMIDIAGADGSCSEADLLLRGFTRGEIAHHGARANRIAVKAAERRAA